MCETEEKQLTDIEWLEATVVRDGLLKAIARLDPDREPDFSKWYAGITTNIIRRLLEHHVSEEKADLYYYEAANSQAVAEAVEKIMQDVYGMDGEPGGAAGDANIVYVYKKAPHTVP
jgi:hypothetical protein